MNELMEKLDENYKKDEDKYNRFDEANKIIKKKNVLKMEATEVRIYFK